jgi:cephalosporin hydroxylase
MIEPLPGWSFEQSWSSFDEGWFQQVYEGRALQKMPQDLWRYHAARMAAKPTLIIETGTRQGGSALWFRRELDIKVISIDTAPAWSRKAPEPIVAGVTFIRGSSTDNSVFCQVAEMVEGERVMVSLDSDHHKDHVKAEIDRYRALVSPGCHLVVEDAIFDMAVAQDARRGGVRIPEEGGALAAIQQSGLDAYFEFGGTRYERDTQIEGLYPESHSPCGWWKRVG